MARWKHELETLPEKMETEWLRSRHDRLESMTRPHTVFTTEKSLPPLLPEAFSSNNASAQVSRVKPGFRSERSASFSDVLEQHHFMRPTQQ